MTHRILDDLKFDLRREKNLEQNKIGQIRAAEHFLMKMRCLADREYVERTIALYRGDLLVIGAEIRRLKRQVHEMQATASSEEDIEALSD